jgi:putative lipoprotein
MHSSRNKIAQRLLFTLFMLSICFFLTGIAWSADHSAGPDASLTGTYWKLLTLNGKDVTFAAGEKELQMVLSAKNQVSGFSGCNRFKGSFERDGEQLQFGPMAATMMMCAEAMEQEQKFLLALESAKRFSIKGEILNISNEKDTEILRFKSVYLQ